MSDLITMMSAAAGQVGGEYQISRSLRFNSADSAYLSRTPASAGNRKTWTWSGWVKRGNIPNDTSQFTFLSAGGSGGDSIMFSDGNKFTVNIGLLGINAGVIPTQVQRDASAWYHFVAAIDTTQATAADRVKMYVNGVQITSFTTTNYPSQNQDATINSTTAHNIGRQTTFGNYLDGYLTEVNFIDGQALTPSSFGETNATTGVWSPIRYAGSYGTNGFYLNFSDNTSTTTLGEDQAGSNNWTPNNFSVTAGAGNDSLVDVPTRNTEDADTGAGGEVRGNYATLNPLFSYTGLLPTNGNLDYVANSANWRTSTSTISMTSGKWYCEFVVNSFSSGGIMLGIVGTTDGPTIRDIISTDNIVIGRSGNVGYGYQNTGNKYTGGSSTSYGASYTASDVIGIALDLDAGTLVFYKNGSSQGTAFSSLTGTFGFGVSVCTPGTTSVSANFGQRPFAYTAPSGFKALVTTNLPEPTVVQGDDYFNTVLYTGNGSTQSITGVGFQPDFVWNKYRNSGSNWHNVSDIVRGAGYRIFPNDTGAEQFSATAYLTSFNADGFSVGSSNDFNESAGSYVAWNWKANGAGVSNTDGTISSTVSVSTTSGFSIVTYTGNNTLAQSVGHGLGVAPAMIIVKSRSNVTNWLVWQKTYNVDSVLLLNGTDALITGLTGIWGSANPTSTTFGLNRLDSDNNRSGQTYVAYCFAEVEGFSKFGSYTGNGSATDGSFVYVGFKPAFVMVKRTNDTGSWRIFDDARSPENVVALYLYANLSNADDTGAVLDFVSNGFKFRNASTDNNASGSTYIYMAFAENPFKYSLAR
jgi:hypothetical protein